MKALVALTALLAGCPRTALRDAGGDDGRAQDVAADAASDVRADVATGCAAFAACGACTGTPGCGWCVSSASCAHGTAAAADDAACARWDFFGATCDPDASAGCAAYTSCGDCAADPACGWCASSGTCAAGDVSGPFGATCATTAWRFTSDRCALDAGNDAQDVADAAGLDASAPD